MKQFNYLKYTIALFIVITFSTAAKIDINTVKRDGQCDQTIIYYISKIANGDQKIEVAMQVMVDPGAKLIKLYAKVPGENDAADFQTVIESAECTFNETLTKGSALYKGYIKQADGSTSKAMIKIVADENGKLSIVNADPDKQDKMIMFIDKWAIVKD